MSAEAKSGGWKRFLPGISFVLLGHAAGLVGGYWHLSRDVSLAFDAIGMTCFYGFLFLLLYGSRLLVRAKGRSAGWTIAGALPWVGLVVLAVLLLLPSPSVVPSGKRRA
jgi:hypothetical protein